MSRSKSSMVPIIPEMEEKYLELLEGLKITCETSKNEIFADLLKKFLLPEADDSSEESKYFAARFTQDLHKKRLVFDQETTHKIIQNCGAAPGKIFNPKVAKANIKILESMDSFNRKFDVPFFDLGSRLTKEDSDNMREAQRLLSTNEKWSKKYDEMLHTLEHEYSTDHKVQNTRLYRDPQKNILAILKDFTHVRGFEGEGTEANIWEAYKILFGTGKRADEITNFYLKPIIQVLLVSARDDGLEIFAKSHGKELITEHGVGTELGTCYVSEKKLKVTGQNPKLLAEVIAHEATHLADYTISKHVISEELVDQLNPIIESLPEKTHRTLSGLLSYPREQWATELLARGIQLIAAEKEDGLKILRLQAPDLLIFYKDIFLPECRRYVTKKLAAKPLSLQSFEENFSETSSIESGDEGEKEKIGRLSRAASRKENAGGGYDADDESPLLPRPTSTKPKPIAGAGEPTTFVAADAPPLPAPTKARARASSGEKTRD